MPQCKEFPHDYDECYTPEEIWDDILPLLPRDRTLVDPFNGGRFAEWGARHGLDARATTNFWSEDLPPGCVVVSNPPYTLKEEIIIELLDRDVPFVLLVPVGILFMRALDRMPDFKLVIWNRVHRFIRVDGLVRAKQLAIIHDVPAPPITFVPCAKPQWEPARCACGARVKSTSRKRHVLTNWHLNHGTDGSDHRRHDDGDRAGALDSAGVPPGGLLPAAGTPRGGTGDGAAARDQ